MKGKRKQLFSFILAIIFAFLPIFSFAESNCCSQKTIRIAVCEWPPYQSKKAKYFGGANRILTEAFAEFGVKVEYVWLPWKRAVNNGQLGLCDCVAVGQKAIEWKDSFLFSDPVMNLKNVFFHLKDFHFDWKDIEDLKKFRIGIQRGYSYGDKFYEAKTKGMLTLDVANTETQTYKKLLCNRIDLHLADLEVTRFLLTRDFPDQSSKIIAHPRPFQTVQLYLMISKKCPESEYFLKKFNEGLRKLKESGKDIEYLNDSITGKYNLD
jgi:polar amino acid transport system substrate-binding protein